MKTAKVFDVVNVITRHYKEPPECPYTKDDLYLIAYIKRSSGKARVDYRSCEKCNETNWIILTKEEHVEGEPIEMECDNCGDNVFIPANTYLVAAAFL
jgi:hypothetical protein